MKTKALSMMGLGLAVACLCLAPQSPAAKGGIPGKPGGGEDPPPEPTTPISYQRVDIQPQPNQLSGYKTGSINDQGVVAGTYATRNHPESNGEFTVMLPPGTTGTDVAYWADDVVVLGTNETTSWMGGATFINNNDQVAGAYFTWADVVSTNYWFDDLFYVYTNELYRAVLWNNNGSRSYLWSAVETDLSRSCAINDAGWVVIANCEDEAEVTKDNWWATLASYVVVPVDSDADGTVDTWFMDGDGDGINDLPYLIDTLGYQPMAINESGQIVFNEGVLLTPDFDDPDGDGNPWFADADSNGINDLLQALRPLEDIGTVKARDINDLGQVVGYSLPDGWTAQAVVWTNAVALPNYIGGRPTKQTERTYATGINNAGQIIGYYYEKIKGGGTNPNQTQGARGFLFQDGEIYCFSDITTDGSIAGRPQDINENGWIVSGGAVYIPVEQP